MNNTYRKRTVAVPTRISFDPSNYRHMLDYASFLKYNNWRTGCRYFLEDPYTDIPSMLSNKVVEYRMAQYMSRV